MAIVLQAQGNDESNKLILSLIEGNSVIVGRAPKEGWAIPWDKAISRNHATMVLKDHQLNITCQEKAANPIVINGERVREATVSVGDTFRIGQTWFSLEVHGAEEPGATTVDLDEPIQEPLQEEFKDDTEDVEELSEFSYRPDELEKFDFADPVAQMEILSRLPQQISGTTSDTDLAATLVDSLLDAIPQAVATAVVQYDGLVAEDLANPERSGFDPSRPTMMRVAVRDDFSGRFRPSRRMISKALQDGSSVMHIWSGDEEVDGQFTMTGSLDWAFCTPVTSESCLGWCLYVSGEGGGLDGGVVSEDALKGDLRFAELVSQFIGSIRQVRLLEEHKTRLSSFFSPTVMESLTGKDAKAVLEPSEREVTVLFCDVRGFSLKSEKLQDDLLQLLQSVKAALGVMANSIVDFDGAIADFQGDAALGFWGWPVASEGPIPACRAALKIHQEFNNPSEINPLLDGFSIGVGVAHGIAIAGEIGTDNQMKVGVFGPVVNQGARFESMTKQFGVAICIDETSAKYVRQEMPTSEARVRTLARVRPKGMGTAITVSELIPPLGESDIQDETIAGFEKAVEKVFSGEWDEALEIFHSLPKEDAPTQALIGKLAEYDNKPPADWDGAFSLTKK